MAEGAGLLNQYTGYRIAGSNPALSAYRESIPRGRLSLFFRNAAMDLQRLKAFAEAQLAVHGLAEQGWRFRFDHAKQRFGACRYGQRLVTVSRHLAALNDEPECRDTVLHEIAHALAGPAAGHGPKWKRMCLRVGAMPRRCYDAAAVKRPPPAYWGVCPGCDHRIPYYRRPRTPRACGACCHRHNSGRYTERFRLAIVDG